MPARLRMADARDAEQIAAIYAPFCTSTIISFEEIAPTPDEMAGRISKITQRFPWLVLDNAGTILGYAYASQHRERAAYRWSVDTTVYVADGARRQGVGRRLYDALFRLLVLQGYYKAFAGVTLPNPGSEGLHEAMGFKPVGVYHGVGYKFGAWHDVRWYERELQPEIKSPAEPKVLRQIIDHPEFGMTMADS